MYVETKFLRLLRAVELGDDIDGWRVCWRGGWDKCRVLFVVMVERGTDARNNAAPIPVVEAAHPLFADARLSRSAD
jgi:hypothetical protein